MRFEDRAEAGRALAAELSGFQGEDVVALAIPRGGVEVAAEICRRWGWPLDVVVPRKVGSPFNPELGIGAIAPGVRVIDEGMVESLRVSSDYLEAEIARQEAEIDRRTAAYRAGRPEVDVSGRVAVLIDDGVATGGTAIAAIRWAKAAKARRVILSVPVAPLTTLGVLEKEADEVVCLMTPEPFRAVGEWYRRFDQTTDEDVVRLLAANR